MLTRLQQELNTRFLEDRGLLPLSHSAATSSAPFTLHAEMHQHQHEHQHLHHHHQHHLLNTTTTPSLDPVGHVTIISYVYMSGLNLNLKHILTYKSPVAVNTIR